MKKLILILLTVFSLIQCSKEKDIVYPSSPGVVSNELRQEINGNVVSVNGCLIVVYEDFGDGVFVNSNINHYENNSFPYTFTDTIKNPFYVHVQLHNTSLYTPTNKGYISVDIFYNDTKVVTLLADSTKRSLDFTSVIYND